MNIKTIERKNVGTIATFMLLALTVLNATAQNNMPLQLPVIQTKYTADPAPMVYNDTVYLYTGHDEDDAFGFKMLNWLLYTSTDMVNWTEHGVIAGVSEPYKTFGWADGHSAWAAQCIERNGKFYFYCPTIHKGKMAIGVAVSNSPYGPFADAIGKPLVFRENHGDYDPTVFIDDDGQAYMYWGGNGPCYYAKLNEDMISLDGEIHIASIDFTGTPPEASFTEGLKTEFVTEWERNIPWDKGTKITDRLFVTSIHNGDYIKVQGVDFSKGATKVEVSVASLYGGKIEIRTDKIDGMVIATININTSGEGDKWRTLSAPVAKVSGVHDLFFVFKGEKDLFNFDWWQFSK